MSFRVLLATAAMVAALGVPDRLIGQECNPCHFCPDQEHVYIGSTGVSTVYIDSPPVIMDCRETCREFGDECDSDVMQTVGALAQEVLGGRIPSVSSFAHAHPELVRSIPARGMVVVLSPCDQSWLLAFPGHPEEMRRLEAITPRLQAG